MDEGINLYYRFHDKKLGEGGFAKVRLATHLATGQNVAIKCLDKLKLGPELPRVYNEIDCLKRLKHHNIARLYQVFETRTSIYLVLEYCAGGELFDYISRKSKIDENESAQILHDLMRVLDFIHANGFAHRDLKPENVMFDDKHHIKLIDFGLAANCSAQKLAVDKNQAPIDQLSTCCGSVTYAAPEVISGRVYCGTAVDVWSAGIMLYALLVGQLPFNDKNIPMLYQKIQGGIKSLPEFLSEDASDLIKRMLTIDPRHRITVREVISHPWLRKRCRSFARIQRRLEFGRGLMDEQLLLKCREKFPHLTLVQLREYIKSDYNYYSTTYQLMQLQSPPRSMAIKRTPDRIPLNSPSKFQQPQAAPAPIQGVSPVKRTRFVTVTNSPQVPKTPPAYLRSMRASGLKSIDAENNCFTPVKIPTKSRYKSLSERKEPKLVVKQTPKKSIVKRLIESATPSKLRKIIDNSKRKKLLNLELDMSRRQLGELV